MDKSNNWIVLEAKGRSNGFSDALLQKAKRQSRRIATIGRRRPILNVGAVMYFERNILKLKWQDPSPNKKSMRLGFIKLTDVIRHYYSPFLELAKSSEYATSDGRDIRISLPMLDITLYVPKQILQLDKLTKDEYSVEKFLRLIRFRVLRYKREQNQGPERINTELQPGKVIEDGLNVATVMLGDGIKYEFGALLEERIKKDF